MKKIYILIFLAFIFLIQPGNLIASENTACDNRYVTLVNPVRSRDLWVDKSTNPLKKQYEIANQYHVPVTWLLQYDILKDKGVLDEIKKFDSSQEIGIFLEVSQDFAQAARVIYPHSVPWFSPKAVFLSAYSQSERRRLIDKLFADYKIEFGSHPKSVGAWWIDSYSLNYMKDKYDIKAAMIVADQKTTDNYGVWGQWWGVPYYPSKANILTPAGSLDNKLDVVITQWAQRHPLLAFGEGFKSSYSLQANDYTLLGQDINFFKELVNIYFNCTNPLGQITIGLETGMEGEKFTEQYREQLTYLNELKVLKFVTLSKFAAIFANTYKDFPRNNQIQFQDSTWELTTNSRLNKKFKETIVYNPGVAFNDYFIPDRSDLLLRYLPISKIDINEEEGYWWLMILPALPLIFFTKLLKRIKFNLLFAGLLFWLAVFGLVLRSGYQYGWVVYYGPVLSDLNIANPILLLISFLLIFLVYFIGKKYFDKNPYSIYLICLVFGLDFLVEILRFTYLSGKYYFGFALDELRFAGVSFSNFSGIEFVNQDLPAYQTEALLRLDFNKIWENLWLAIIIYPLVHILFGLILVYIFSKLTPLLKKVITIVMVILFTLYLINLFGADPRIVL